MAKFRIEYLFAVILFFVVVVSLGEEEGKEEGKNVERNNGSSIIQPRGEGKLKGEDDYAQFSISYVGGGPEYLSISGASLGYGKWVPGWGDYSTEIGSPNGKTLYPGGGEVRIAAAGRSWSPSGTDGSFDIYYSDPQYQYKVAHITFNACYGCEISPYSIQKFLDGYFKITGTVINGGSHIYGTLYVTWIYGTVSASAS